MTEESLQQIKNKFVLIDTNILIDASKSPKDFVGFFSLLHKYQVQSLLDYTIQLEFIRGARSLEESNKMQEFLYDLLGKNHSVMKPSEDIYRIAKEISIVLNKTSEKALKLGDCLISAYVAKYSNPKNGLGQVYLATQNHSDFSSILFKNIHLEPVKLRDGRVKLIGLYKFEFETFNKILDL